MIICDLDGTLYDDAERKKRWIHSRIEKKLEPDWESYHADSKNDSPIYTTFTMLDDFLSRGRDIAFWTGRNEKHRRETEIWLGGHGFASSKVDSDKGHIGPLFMRPNDNTESSVDLKRQWLKSLVCSENISMILENDPRIVGIAKPHKDNINCYIINGGTHGGI